MAPEVPGGVSTSVVTLTAKVSDIDHTTRHVTLVDDQGGRETIQVGPEAVNFDQISVEDTVKVEVAEELVVYLRGLTIPHRRITHQVLR